MWGAGAVRGAAPPAARRPRPARAGGARGLGDRAARGRDARARAGAAWRPERVPAALPAGLRPAAPTAGAGRAATRMADAAEERRWERERTSELAFMAARLSGARERELMRVAFLVHGLGLWGGVGVVVEHARRLRLDHGFDAQLVLAAPSERPTGRHGGLVDVPRARARAGAREERWDVAVATWWETVFVLHRPARRRATPTSCRAWRSASTRPSDPGAHGRRAHARPTAGVHHRGALDRRPAARCAAASRACSTCATASTRLCSHRCAAPPAPAVDGPLRVLVEGSPAVALKGVGEALAATRAMHEPQHGHARLRRPRPPRAARAPTASSARSRRRDGARVRRHRRRAQALARRGHVRAAAGGLPPRRDLRGDAGHRPRRVRLRRRQRARDPLGRRARAPHARSTCSRATVALLHLLRTTRWRRRARGRRRANRRA